MSAPAKFPNTGEDRRPSSRTPGDGLLRVEKLWKGFAGRDVLREVDFIVRQGCIFTVLGPSGAGKSVLLKCLANVEQPDSGRIVFDGILLDFGQRSARESFHLRCSFLFQGNALFDSLTAAQNVSLPLEQTTNLGRSEIRRRAMEALDQLELADYGDHYPAMLSGGMQKRLALARAIVSRPEMVFFDEPTAGLDPLRRNAVFGMIAKYQLKFGFTALIVTHDVVEALEVSDEVALLHDGSICFCGTPGEFAISSHPVVRSFRDSPEELRSMLAGLRRGEDLCKEENE